MTADAARTGLAGLHKRAEELSSQRQSFGLRKFTTEFRWDGNKPAAENALYLRILGDDLIVPTQMHRAVPLPENKFFFGVCRRADPIKDNYCYVCDVLAKGSDLDTKQKKRNGLIPADVAVGLAVEMEAVMEKRVFVGYKPKMVEFPIPETTDAERNGEATDQDKEYRKLLDALGQPGTKVTMPNIGLMIGTLIGQQALWDYATRRPTISDRVYEISRHGNMLQTKWDWNHEGKDQDMPDPTPLLEEYRAKYPFELPSEWVIRNASQDRYNYFFKLTSDAGEESGEKAASAAKDDEVKPVSSSRDALMERLKGRGGNS